MESNCPGDSSEVHWLSAWSDWWRHLVVVNNISQLQTKRDNSADRQWDGWQSTVLSPLVCSSFSDLVRLWKWLSTTEGFTVVQALHALAQYVAKTVGDDLANLQPPSTAWCLITDQTGAGCSCPFCTKMDKNLLTSGGLPLNPTRSSASRPPL